jgi:hypothetical protein
MIPMQGKTIGMLWKAMALAVVLALALPWVALAQVGTDQQDYQPGSVVTISGGNDASGAPGYWPGAAVSVAVAGPHDPAVASTTCENVPVGADGAWSCTVTLWADAEWAVGSYTYTATSTAPDGGPITESGTFTDTRTITAVTLKAGGITIPQLPWGPFSLTLSGGATIEAKVSVWLSGLGDNNWKSTAWAITRATPASNVDMRESWKPQFGVGRLQ